MGAGIPWESLVSVASVWTRASGAAGVPTHTMGPPKGALSQFEWVSTEAVPPLRVDLNEINASSLKWSNKSGRGTLEAVLTFAAH